MCECNSSKTLWTNPAQLGMEKAQITSPSLFLFPFLPKRLVRNQENPMFVEGSNDRFDFFVGSYFLQFLQRAHYIAVLRMVRAATTWRRPVLA